MTESAAERAFVAHYPDSVTEYGQEASPVDMRAPFFLAGYAAAEAPLLVRVGVLESLLLEAVGVIAGRRPATDSPNTLAISVVRRARVALAEQEAAGG